jgi:uncharacterized protein
MAELKKPGRDPRAEFEVHSFSDEAHEIKDLKKGMMLPGIVTNVTNFGAFVDIGVHQDGLVHVSELSDKFVRDPFEVVKVNQKVKVRVIDVDIERKRIGLSLKSERDPREEKGKESKVGQTPKLKVAPKSPFAALASIRNRLK